jgi:hypothetical protein
MQISDLYDLRHQYSHKGPDDVLHLTHFEVSWATELEKQWLGSELRRRGRQSMNIRVMTDARFIFLKTQLGEVVGWAGLDIDFNKKYPEMFSLQITEPYQKFSLGLLLEAIRADYMLKQGIKIAFVRMAENSTFRLLGKRLDSKHYRLMSPVELDNDYLNLCQRCELLGNKCERQVYLQFDVASFSREAQVLFGPINAAQLPMKFQLEPVDPMLVAKNDDMKLKRQFQPLWL